MTCAGAGTATSDPLHVSTSPYNQCYCAGIAFTVQVEPICHVDFAGIDQASPGTVDGAPAVEDFTGLAPAEVSAGSTYAIAVTSNTNGNFTDRITAFFDWDHDGLFEASLLLSAITNANCDAAATGTVDVPPDALPGTSRMRLVKNAGPAPTDPCGSYSYGQAEDYRVNVSVPMPCDALPIPGATQGPDSICPDMPFTLTVANMPTGAGISVQWESSADGSTWAPAPGASTGPAYNTSQTEATWYRAQVTCDQAGTGTSDPLLIHLRQAFQCYCGSLNFSYQVQPICHVSFAGINNGSSGTAGSAPPLEDFTALPPANVVTGFSYPLALRGYSDLTTSQAAAFFDWDQDGTFEAAVPLGSIANDSCATELTALVAVPANAAPGLSRMRVLLGDFQVPADPCGTYVSGQGEDYLVHVSEAVACNGLPAPGNTLGPDSICPAVPFTLHIEQVQLETGISYQWQASTDGLTWSDAPGNSNQASFTTSLTDTTWYRAQVACLGGDTAYSTEHRVALAPAAECYCTGIGFAAMVQPICHVAFADLAHGSDGTLNGSPGLEDFSSLAATVARANSYTLSAAGNANEGSGFVSAFFDWDGNGVFETAANIGVLGGAACADTVSLAITVPAAATLGQFRMRVVMNAGNYATDPCTLYDMGQAEEYGLVVTSVSAVAERGAAARITAYPNPARTELLLATPGGLPAHVQVFDMTGKLVLEQRQTTRLNVATLAPGAYGLVLLDEQGSPRAHARFLKQ